MFSFNPNNLDINLYLILGQQLIEHFETVDHSNRLKGVARGVEILVQLLQCEVLLDSLDSLRLSVYGLPGIHFGIVMKVKCSF